ncbi:MAG: hypothetical protein J5858_16760 [Lentisphaeria bacterium]|nr:hypothetical protein [Lentisphaeria bacterium]
MMTAKRILIAASILLLAGAAAAADQNRKADGTAQSETEPPVRKKISPEEEARIRELQNQRNDLLQKIHQKRVELLKNDPKLRRMYMQLLKQTRELAMELDANREMRLMNDELNEINRKLDREQKK